MSLSEIQNRTGLLFTSSWFQYQQYTLVFNSSQDFLTKVLPCSYFEVRKAMTYVVQNGVFFYNSYNNQHFESPRLSTKCFPHRIQVQYLFNVGQILRFKNQNLSNETTQSQKYGIRIICGNLQVAQLLTLLAFCRQVTLCSSLMI